MYVHAVGRKCIPVAVNVAQQLKEDARVAASSCSGGESKVVKVESYSQAVDIRGKDSQPWGNHPNRSIVQHGGI